MSFTSLVVILAIALVIFGPEDLPKIARALGKLVNSVKKITGEFSKEFKEFGDITKEPEKVLMKAFDTPAPKPLPKAKPTTQSATVEDEDDEDDEELLTYDVPVPKEGKEKVTDDADQDPFAGLPEDMVSYEKEKDN